MTIANAFILFLGVGAAWLSIAAFVQKKTKKRRDENDRSSNAAS
jgi:hypothetical protein